MVTDLWSCVQFDFPPDRSGVLRDRTREPILHQRWQFRVIGGISNFAATAKTPLHEKDLKVAELVLSGAAKSLREHARCDRQTP